MVFLALAAAARVLAGQYFFDSFGTDSGLPQPNVTAIVQTHDGYLWVGTEGGLARFDGVRFVPFKMSSTPGFDSDSIRCLYEDRENNLWVGTEEGVLCYRQGHFEPAGLKGVAVRVITQDQAGRIWIGTNGQGLYVWEQQRFRRFDRTGDFPNPTILSLYADSSGRLWIGCEGDKGVVCLEPGASGQSRKQWNLQSDAMAICEQPRGTMWFGTHSHGVFRLQNDELTRYRLPSAGRIVTDMRPGRAGGFWVAAEILLKMADVNNIAFTAIPHAPSEDVRVICEDREGSLWLGCGKGDGLIRVRQASYRLISTEEGLPRDGVRTVTQDKNGNIWLAIERSGLTEIKPTGETKVFTIQDGFPTADPLIAYAAGDGSIWTGSNEALCIGQADGWKAFPEIKSIYGIYEDRQHIIWVGTRSQGLFRFKEGSFTPIETEPRINFATSFCDTADGTMYIGTWESGVYRLQDGKLTVFNHDNGLPVNAVRAVYVDKRGLLWVGMKGRGLAVQVGGHWLNPNALSQAVADHVTAIAEDAHGELWLGTAAGVMHAPRDEILAAARGERAVPKMSIAGTAEGFEMASVWSGPQPVVWTTQAHELLFATRRGVLVIDPDNLPFNGVVPPVHIEKVTLDGQVVDAAEEIQAPAGTRSIAIEYTAPSFLRPNRVLFEYMLEGYDRDWNEAETRRAAFYTNLPPGKYVFRVKACNSDGLWNNEGARMVVIQEPHFYQTWWFYILATAGAAGLVWGINRWSHRLLMLKAESLEQKQAMEKERRRIAKNLHDDLGANLTALGLFAETIGQKTNSPGLLQDMAQLSERVFNLAEALDAVVWTVNPANDSLDRLALYICGLFQDLFQLTAIRSRLDVSAEIPPRVLTPDERSNLFLTAKEAMNNVIKHSRATEVWLRIKMDGGTFSLAIEDNGRGFDPDEATRSGRNGLINMCSRIEELKGAFRIESAPGRGTAVLIMIDFAAREGISPVGRVRPATAAVTTAP
jgi:signal transduction histidine kinase/streptogramin lyase